MFYDNCFNASEMKRKIESNPSATSQLSILLMNTFYLHQLLLESQKFYRSSLLIFTADFSVSMKGATSPLSFNGTFFSCSTPKNSPARLFFILILYVCF
jgi:hypothetical protein